MTAFPLLPKIAITAGFAVLALFISIIIVRWLLSTMRVEADQTKTLRLQNQGNCTCQYHLSLSSPAPNLEFTLYADGVPLAPVYEEIEEEVLEEKPVAKQKSEIASTKPAQNTSEQSSTKTASIDSEKALKKGQDVSAKSGVVANFLGILGSILPGKLGDSLKSSANTARQAQKASASAVQAPRSAQRKMNAMKSSGSRLGIKADKVQEAGVAQPTVGTRKNISKREQSEFSRSSRETVKKIKRSVKKVGAFQTIDLHPSETLFLTLVIGKKEKRYPTGSFGYTIESKPIPINKKLGTAPAAIKKGQVHFSRIGIWRYWMPAFSVTLYLILTALLTYYLILFIWA